MTMRTSILDTTDTPGPGEYSSGNSFFTTSAESFSKKGYGNGFVSKTKRDPLGAYFSNTGPGPGFYQFYNNSISPNIYN